MRLLVVCLFLIFCTSTVYATSCRDLSDSYYFLCIDGECVESVAIIEVQSRPFCSRRIDIGVAPQWMRAFVSQAVSNSDDGVYKMDDTIPYFSSKDSNVEDFLNRKIIDYRAYKEMENEQFNSSQLILLMNERNSDWLTSYSSVAQRQVLDDVVKKYRSDEWSGKVKEYYYWSVLWGGLLFYLLFSVWSINRFYKNIYSNDQVSIIHSWKLTVCLQLAFLLLLFGLLTLSRPDVYVTFSVFIPVLAVILVAEFAHLINRKIFKGK